MVHSGLVFLLAAHFRSCEGGGGRRGEGDRHKEEEYQVFVRSICNENDKFAKKLERKVRVGNIYDPVALYINKMKMNEHSCEVSSSDSG
jgi:hypothetical protein